MAAIRETTGTSSQGRPWRDAVIYQIYPRSFADADGDGVGDIAGMTSHLDYVASLGVDAVWVSPWYSSPMNDGGYDVRDYRSVDPIFGTDDDAMTFIEECHRRNLRVILDLVGNHCSVEHPWFQAALHSPVGSPERDWFYFRDGRGEDASLPPTDWISVFGGSAWTREELVGGESGQWYLNVFDSSQPDLKWSNPAVAQAFDEILRFWFDRGVDGLRLDAIPAIGKDETFEDIGFAPDERWAAPEWPPMPFWDASGVHEVMRRWRRVADEYDPPRHLIGEVLVGSHERLARYVRADELHSVFSIGVSILPWEATAFRDFVTSMAGAIPVGPSWVTWTLSSHDEIRTVSRYCVDDEGLLDLDLGRARSRALHMLVFALPGSACLYQGEEWGLEQHANIPTDLLQDPIFLRTQDPTLSRDGCRVPLPWSDQGPTFGFNDTSATWLPQPSTWGSIALSVQENDPTSFVNFTRELVAVRHRLSASLSITWDCDSDGDVVTLSRGEDFRCLVNMGATPVGVPEGWRVVLASWSSSDVATLPASGAAWLVRDVAG